MYYPILKFMPLGPIDLGDFLLLYYMTAGNYTLGNLKPIIFWEGWGWNFKDLELIPNCVILFKSLKFSEP